MTSSRCLEFLLLLILLPWVYSEEPEPMLTARGNFIEIGYCFGVDYIVVYRSAPEGDQLLGNSSANATVTPPADLQGRIRLNQHEYLLGLQISNLTHMDSGFYRRECWQNHTLVKNFTQQLSVCDEEVEAEEIAVREDAEGTELVCNSTSIGLEGTSVRWYSEMYPSYKFTLFLDTSVSLEPLVEELQGVVQVKNRGASLVLKKSVFKKTHHFHCLVAKGENCLSFQNMFLPDRVESWDIFASQGESLVLDCPSDGENQQWETPLGKITDNSTMHISHGDKSAAYSLVIPAVSDEHIGEYSCSSTSQEVQYFLALCPKRARQEKDDPEGGIFSLECKSGQDEPQRVQWYRAATSGAHQLLHDPSTKAVPVPEDLKGRLTVSDNGSLFTISSVERKHSGLYWCVVLTGPDDEYDNYAFDYSEEDTEEDGYGDDQYMHDTNRCIFKQETYLTVKSVTLDPNDSRSLEPSNVVAYAVVGGVVALLVVVGIIAVIAIKKRKAVSRSGPNTDKDIRMDDDPKCATSLTSDEHVA